MRNVTAKYVYIATVGDSITRAGLEHLCQVAEEFASDLVISKPRFINAAGQALPDDRWLIDEILQGRKIERPQALSRAEQFLFTVTNLWCALTGSSASNLYRTDFLRQRPFPLEFGMAGDGAWGVQNVFDLKTAVTPRRFSTFRQHPKTYAAAGYQIDSLGLKLFRLAQQVVAGSGAKRGGAGNIGGGAVGQSGAGAAHRPRWRRTTGQAAAGQNAVASATSRVVGARGAGPGPAEDPPNHPPFLAGAAVRDH